MITGLLQKHIQLLGLGVSEVKREAGPSSIACAIDAMSSAINKAYYTQTYHSNLVVLTIMNGGVIFAGHLIPQLSFTLSCDFVHVGRYGDKKTGAALAWFSKPRSPLKGKIVLLLDDLLDEGDTLTGIKDWALSEGALECRIAVLADKGKSTIKADFVGMSVPDKFLFGYGMDYKGYGRNLPCIYSVS